jgi:hypothetical protein
MFKNAATLVLFPVLILMGFIAGRFVGKGLVTNLILKDSMFPLLLSRPVNQFYDMYILINSRNPYTRLSGYYSLIDNKMINNQFLMERYQNEENYVIKRTILWILSFSEDSDSVLKFYSSIFDKNDILLRDILVFMKHVNREYYTKFIEINKIDRKLLPAE